MHRSPTYAAPKCWRWWLPALCKQGGYPSLLLEFMNSVRRRLARVLGDDRHANRDYCWPVKHVQSDRVALVEHHRQAAGRDYDFSIAWKDRGSPTYPRHRNNGLRSHRSCIVQAGGRFVIMRALPMWWVLQDSAPMVTIRFQLNVLLDNAAWIAGLQAQGYVSMNDVMVAMWTHGRVCFDIREALNHVHRHGIEWVGDLTCLVIEYI